MHVGRGEFDVAQRRHFEFSVVSREARDGAHAFVHIGKFQSIVVQGRAGNKVVGAVAGGAGGVADLAEKYLTAQNFLRGEVGEVAGHADVVFRFRGNDRADELRERAADAVGGDGGAAEGDGEQVGVKRFGGEPVGERFERHAHFNRILNRLQHLVFKRVGAFVPEKMFALIPAGVAQAHGIPGADAAVEADAELARVGKPMRLLVARGTGHRLICGKPLVVKQHAAQRRARVRRDVGGGHVVLRGNGLDEKTWGQNLRGVIEGH